MGGHSSHNGPLKWYEKMSITHVMGKYSRFACRRPFLSLFITNGIALILTLIVFGGGFLTLNENGGNEWDIRGATETSRFDALVEAMDQSKQSLRQAPGARPVLPRSEINYGVSYSFIYTSKRGNMLTPENMAIVRQIEQVLLDFPSYGTIDRAYCRLRYGGSNASVPLGCDRPSSLAEIYYGPASTSTNIYERPGYSATLRDNFDTLTRTLSTAPRARNYLSRDFTDASLRSRAVRSSIYLGKPLPPTPEITYEGLDEDDKLEEENTEIFNKLMDDVATRIFDILGTETPLLKSTFEGKDRSVGDVEVLFFAPEYYGNEFGDAAFRDFIYAAVSAILVYLYMFYHTRSMLAVLISIVNNFFSFPVGFFFFRLIFQVKYFASIQLVLMFIVLGIGADDIFVFMDAFKQSGTVAEVCHSLESRVEYTTKRAARAIFVTSITTAIGFFATAISPIVPIVAFGLFSGIVIMILWLLTVLNLPAILFIYGRSYEDLEWYQCSQCCANSEKLETKRQERQAARMYKAQSRPDVTAELTVPGSTYNKADGSNASPSSSIDKAPAYGEDGTGKMTRDQSLVDLQHVSEPKLRRVEAFFHGPYYRFVMKYRWAIAILGAAFFAVGLALTTQIRPPASSDQWFPKSHMLQKSINRQNGGEWLLAGEDEYDEVVMVWGLNGMNTDDSDQWDTSDRGKLSFDADFSLPASLSPAAQTFLTTVCDRAAVAPCGVEGCNDLGFLVAFNETNCFTDGMAAWLELTYPTDTNMRFGRMTSDQFFDALVAFSKTTQYVSNYNGHIGLFYREGFPQPDLKYLALEVTSSYKGPTSLQVTKEVIDEWEVFMDQLNSEAPEGLKNGYATGGGSWVYYQTQLNLLNSALSGIGIVFALAFVIIVAVTFNWMLAILSIYAIAGVIVCTIGIAIVSIMSWDLGVAESVAVVILIGFSMDYILHIAEAYITSLRSGRADRVQDALTHLGVSVLAGLLTNVLAASILWAATFSFFNKFAWLIQSVSVIAFLWAVLFFPATAAIIGPQGDFGDVRQIGDWIGRKRKSSVANSETQVRGENAA